MDKYKQKLYRFMYGRYGNDVLNTFLLFIIVIGILCNSFFIHKAIFTYIIWVILFLNIWRTYSRNITQRRKENDVFLRYIRPFRRYFFLLRRRMQDKDNKYYLCRKCQQMVRVPKGRGKITITCPVCKNKFSKKS